MWLSKPCKTPHSNIRQRQYERKFWMGASLVLGTWQGLCWIGMPHKERRLRIGSNMSSRSSAHVSALLQQGILSLNDQKLFPEGRQSRSGQAAIAEPCLSAAWRRLGKRWSVKHVPSTDCILLGLLLTHGHVRRRLRHGHLLVVASGSRRQPGCIEYWMSRGL